MGRLFEAIGRADGAIGNRREAKGYRRKARVNQQTSKGGLLIAFNESNNNVFRQRSGLILCFTTYFAFFWGANVCGIKKMLYLCMPNVSKSWYKC
jgi:hypothetical protein